MASSAPPPPAQPHVGASELAKQLDALAGRIEKLALLGGCYADLESQLASARAQLQSGKLAEARDSHDKVFAAVCRGEASAHAEPMAWNLLWLEVAYLVLILGLGYVVKRYPHYPLWDGLIGFKSGAAWFGALGGVTIGIYGIYTHISAKDFDPTFRLWYVCKPVMGAIFGWFVFLVYYVGVLSATESVDIKKPELSYLIAFLAGFSERFTIKTIDRFMTVLTSGDDKKDKSDSKNKSKTGGNPTSATP
jgi:hypothetical protein